MQLRQFEEREDSKAVWLNREELEALLDKTQNEHQRLALGLRARSGMRVSEAIAIRGEDINNADTITSDTVTSDKYESPGGVQFKHLERVAERDGNTADISSFDSLSGTSERQIVLRGYFYESNQAQDFFLRVNGDGSSTGNYDYREVDGTVRTNQDQYFIAENIGSAFGGVHFEIIASAFFESVFATNYSLPRFKRTRTVASNGQRDGSDLNSIQLIPASGGNAKLDVQVFERKFVP